ncbi:MAG: ROK family protein [Gaiellales bacterium]
MLAGIELGGTKIVCLVGAGPDDVVDEERIETRDPGTTLAEVRRFLERHAPAAIGIASFGPVELRPSHPEYGHITRTTKPGWSGTDVIRGITGGNDVPVGFQTDVNGAALGEGRWGAATGLDSFVYVTVGTGIGGGVVSGGRLVGGLGHTELGHVPVPRHPADDFGGCCPFHRDCFEGMACGPAFTARLGVRLEEAGEAERLRACELASWYLAAAFRGFVYSFAPERIVVGGGVASLPGLLEAVGEHLVEQLAGYPGLPEHAAAGFVTAPGLGGRAGSLGALVLAERALHAGRRAPY